MQICPRKGKFFLATYSGPWKVFGRRNEVLFVKAPKHKHQHDSSADNMSFTAGSTLAGFEVFNVEKLFPEEFEAKNRDNKDMQEMHTDMPVDSRETVQFLS